MIMRNSQSVRIIFAHVAGGLPTLCHTLPDCGQQFYHYELLQCPAQSPAPDLANTIAEPSYIHAAGRAVLLIGHTFHQVHPVP